MKTNIENKLKQKFSPFFLEVINNSHLHSGHYKPENKDFVNESHFAIKIGSNHFVGLSRIAIHRQINQLLEQEFKAGLHAIEIKIIS
jgi:BolA protein